jgi:hypothetical protein
MGLEAILTPVLQIRRISQLCRYPNHEHWYKGEL